MRAITSRGSRPEAAQSSATRARVSAAPPAARPRIRESNIRKRIFTVAQLDQRRSGSARRMQIERRRARVLRLRFQMPRSASRLAGRRAVIRRRDRRHAPAAPRFRSARSCRSPVPAAPRGLVHRAHTASAPSPPPDVSKAQEPGIALDRKADIHLADKFARGISGRPAKHRVPQRPRTMHSGMAQSAGRSGNRSVESQAVSQY